MKLIVFDIDDTLTKSENQHINSFVKTMQHFGISDIDKNWSEYEHLTDSFILQENYERNLNKKFQLSFIDEFEARMTAFIRDLPTVSEVPGAKLVINFLADHSDFAFAFATGSLLQPACLKLKQAEITFHRSLLSASNKFLTREEIVNQAISLAQAVYHVEQFEDIVSVGDGLWDLRTAKNLNLKFVGIGEKNRLAFEKENVKHHLTDWTEVDLNRLLSFFEE
ncbi:MAG: HAD hydrolase-like protein [Flavobacteriales bacterium]|nr:HAD hydrolase-like protein [Flavobacteriales bacterium]